MKTAKGLWLFFLVVCCSTVSWAQPSKVRGQVIDEDTKEPLPFVSVVFVGTTTGTSTDFEGNYFLETREEVDSILVSFIGYQPKKIAVNKNDFKTINVSLKEESFEIEEVLITPGENPAHRIVRGIIANKENNNPNKNNSYQYESYTKMELDLTNISEEFQNKKILKNFKFVFDYVDTSAVTGKAYLPFLISETLSDFYHSKNPKIRREVIKASKISGFDGDNTSIAQLTGRIQQDFNIYDNFIQLFGQGFVSPTHPQALAFYRFYLIDSADHKGLYSYHLSFKPRRTQEAAFTGDFWISAEDFAVVEAKLRVANDVNVNWVNDVLLTDEFQKIEETWFWKKQHMLVDFTLTEKDSTKQKGFLGKRTVHYNKIELNQPPPDRIQKMYSDINVSTEALEKDEAFWEENRPFHLSEQERNIYSMVDSIKNVPLYRTIVDIVSAALTGYYDAGKVEIGPYYKSLSFNDIEGVRFQLGGRTTSDFHKKWQLHGYGAYGTDDEEWKYKFGVNYRISEKNDLWEMAGFHYMSDVDQLGNSENAFAQGNILASLLARNPTNKLTLIDEAEIYYEKEWIKGFSNKIKGRYRQITSTDFVPFQPSSNRSNITGGKLKTGDVVLNTRWAPREAVLNGTFSQMHLGSKYPIFNLNVTLGLKALNGDFNYQKVDFSYEHTIPVNPIGKLYYIATAGKIFGDVPFPLLHLHEGNETYGFDPYSYNLMNYYEFASDQYGSLYAEHHFMGFFLNKIPLLRKLKWRTVASGKALWGSLRDSNDGSLNDTHAIYLFPSGLSELKGPYFEAGVGIENIFKMIRVDAIWRLSELDSEQKIDKFGIRVGLQLTF